MKPHIVDFLKFLESKENKKVPFKAKLFNPDKFSPFTEEELNVEGDLRLAFTDIKSLPDNLKVEGNLSLTQSSIKSLPNNLQVGGTLDLSEEAVEFLPNNLKVEGRLYIERRRTPLFKTKTHEEIKQEIEERGGYVRGGVYLIRPSFQRVEDV